MGSRAIPDDEERQSNTAQHDTDMNQSNPPPEPAPCVSTQQPTLVAQEPQKDEVAKHVCFLCLRGKRRTYYAISIPCHRHRFVQRYKPSTAEGESDLLYPEPQLARLGQHEDDSAIYTKLVEACYAFHGKWKKWVPFYGIVDVRETEFYFNAPTDIDNRFEIHTVPLDHAAILKQCKADLAKEPSAVVREIEDHCAPWDHNSSCLAHAGGYPCIEETLETARRTKASLNRAHLMRNCALEPSKADYLGRSTLNGMLLDRSPIMARDTVTLPSRNRKSERLFTQLQPGIEMVLGWQTDRVVEDVPPIVTSVWFVVAVVWVAVIVGGAVGDQNLWVAFGQLVVASLSLLVDRLK